MWTEVIRPGTGSTKVYFDSSLSGALAVTSTRYHCYWFFGYHYGIDETDIGFNSNYSWTTGAYSYANPDGSPYSFEAVALHEFGHSLGLDHEDRWMATLNSYYPNSGPLGSNREWDPLGDDRLGVRALYPDGTTEVDIAGSALKRTGAGTSGLVSSPLWAARGSYVTIEFTFSNLSTSTETFDIGFYLSTNDIISTGDTWLGTNYGAWGSSRLHRNLFEDCCGFRTRAGHVLPRDSSSTPPTRKGENNESNNPQRMPRAITIYSSPGRITRPTPFQPLHEAVVCGMGRAEAGNEQTGRHA